MMMSSQHRRYMAVHKVSVEIALHQIHGANCRAQFHHSAFFTTASLDAMFFKCNTQSQYFASTCVRRTLKGSLSNNDGNGNENVTRKYIFISFVLLRDYFNSLNFYKNGELSRNQIGRSGVQVKKENQKFTAVRSRSPQNLKCGHFTLLFCRERQEMYQNVKRTCRPIVLRRCRCRRRRRCLSSLFGYFCLQPADFFVCSVRIYFVCSVRTFLFVAYVLFYLQYADLFCSQCADLFSLQCILFCEMCNFLLYGGTLPGKMCPLWASVVNELYQLSS